MECIFCEIIQRKKVGHFIYEDESHVAFLDKYPIDYGHSLVLPRSHFEKVTDMNSENVGDLFSKVPASCGMVFLFFFNFLLKSK